MVYIQGDFRTAFAVMDSDVSFRQRLLDSDRIVECFMPWRVLPSFNILSAGERTATQMRVVINIFLMVLFAGCSLVQANDPDPELWVPVYIVPCLLCCIDMLSNRVFELVMRSVLCYLHISFCICVALVTVYHLLKGRLTISQSLWHEYIRELFGLGLVGLWYIHNAISLHRTMSSQRKMEVSASYALLNIILITTAWAYFPHGATESPSNSNSFNSTLAKST